MKSLVWNLMRKVRENRQITGIFVLGLCIGSFFGLLVASDEKHPTSFEEFILYTMILLGVSGWLLLHHDEVGVGTMGVVTHWLLTFFLAQAGLVPLSVSIQAIALGVYGAVFLTIALSFFFVGPTPPAFQWVKDRIFRREA